MKQPLPSNHPLYRTFAGSVQHVLYAEVGMCDPQLVEYLADLLSKFIHVDDFYPFKDMQGRRLEDLGKMVADAYLGDAVPASQRQRLVYMHIGDFSLFWTGVFPEGLRTLRRVGTKDRLSDYLEQGKRSYAIASELTVSPDEEPPADVLKRLSDEFESCVYGLNLCRREWDAMRTQLPPS